VNADTVELIRDSLWPLLRATVTSTIPLTLITFVLRGGRARAVGLVGRSGGRPRS
jgi:cystine transport system permease protein